MSNKPKPAKKHPWRRYTKDELGRDRKGNPKKKAADKKTRRKPK